MKKNRSRSVTFFLKIAGWSGILISCLLFPPPAGQAASLVTATYLQDGGTELIIRIEVGAPPPSSLILVQKLPPGTNILHSRPPAQKVSPEEGEAKWLFHKLESGILTVSFSLDREVSPAEISGQIRFKPPGEKEMRILAVGKH